MRYKVNAPGKEPHKSFPWWSMTDASDSKYLYATRNMMEVRPSKRETGALLFASTCTQPKGTLWHGDRARPETRFTFDQTRLSGFCFFTSPRGVPAQACPKDILSTRAVHLRKAWAGGGLHRCRRRWA